MKTKILNSQTNKVSVLQFPSVLFFMLAYCLLSANNLHAQQTKEELSAEDLAKKLANPVSSLISLPFQNNSDFGIGEIKLLGVELFLNEKKGKNILPIVFIKNPHMLILIEKHLSYLNQEVASLFQR